jgi:hypothetical protein
MFAPVSLPPSRRRTVADPDGLGLARLLSTNEGRLMVGHFAHAFARLLDETPPGRDLRVRAAWEWAAAVWDGPTPEIGGEAKWNNNLVPLLSRWIVICRPSLRGRIEFRGEPDKAWNDPSLPMPANPYRRWLDPAHPYTPIGSAAYPSGVPKSA